ncbi:MAG: ABC transporter substrate-binding protein [Nitriliruptorales bacterium]|nr:ABC transporter substrate-binding protein [Nitriliruptorales bacterium]
MQRSLWLRRFAVLMVFGLLAAACGGDDEPDTTDTETGTPTETEMTETETETESPTETETGEAIDRPERDEKLDLGYVLPETGALAFLVSPQVEGVRLAVEDINAAGGVLGQDVNLETGDSGTDPAVARQTVARLINGGVDAVVGAAASGVSQEIIQTLHDNEIVQCSASNTSPSFTDQENNTFYFRTVPPDEAVTPVIVNQVTAAGSNIAVAARADDYGQALQELVVQGVEEAGASVVANVSYDPEADDFSSEAGEIASANPDAVVLISFGEGATLIRQLIQEGVSPDALYGADGLFGPALAEQVNPDDLSTIEGMKVIGASGSEEFNARLTEQVDTEGNLIYGAQAYDCAIVTALAAIAAGSADPAVFNDAIADVTKEGTECTSFEECSQLLADGEDIDYNGASGPLDITRPDPTFGRYAVGEFTAEGTIEIIASEDVDLSQLN